MRNRSSLYVVVRHELDVTFDGVVQGEHGGHVVGIYRSHDRAEEVAGQYNQQMTDKNLSHLFHFEVQIGTYYDE